jgi:hypothetical protein
MNLNQIISGLADLDIEDLQVVNRIAVDYIKAKRNADAAAKRHLFKPGDQVQYDGRRGHTVGEIVRVKRKNAVVKVGVERWNVPLTMLSHV